MAACAFIALVGIAGCGAAANPAPAFNGPYGRGGPFAAGTARPAASGDRGPAFQVGGSTALDGVTELPWLFAIGAGVQVSAPAAARAATDTPADATAGFYEAFYAQRFPQACGYVAPAQRAGCPARLRGAGGADVLRVPAIGFVAQKADQALVTMTGVLCRPAAGCLGQQNPGWIFADSRTFGQLWALTAANGGNPLTVTPLVSDAGQWYVDLAAAAPAAG
jgi:hypothetical protein